MNETYPRQKAATRNFQLGAPRSFSITADGAYAVFLRSDHGRDAANSLWVFDVAQNVERKVVDPRELLANEDEDLPAAERARRERMRETTAGITSYSSDNTGLRIAFALSGQLFVTDLASGVTNHLDVTGPIIAPAISPDGSHVAWSTSANVHVCEFDGSNERVLTSNNDERITWGLADFIGSEELGRMVGFWWAPTSDSIIAEKCDDSAVNVWWISDAATPHVEPHAQRYPAAGTTNATVELHKLDLHGNTTRIVWDNENYEYLVSVRWQADRPALITVASRDQRTFVTYALDGVQVNAIQTLHDDEFLEVIPGQPRWVGESLISVRDNRETDTRQIFCNESPVSPAGIQVMALVDANVTGYTAITTATATDRQVVHISPDGAVVELSQSGVHSTTAPVTTDSDTLRVAVGSQLSDFTKSYQLLRNDEVVHEFDSFAETPRVDVRVNMLTTGPHTVNTAVLFPTDHVMGSQKLPVMMRPYGGPHGAMVLNSAHYFADDQWFADQGFVVIIADNRGTPGRGPAWDHAIFHDFVTPVLDDQVAALQEVAKHYPADVDVTRVGITGWSFGGYLSALAVLDRPEHFHVAVAGAPVTEWKWYDTAYTERYLGHPDSEADVYHANSLMHRANELTRPLMLIHGLSDDNVVAAHSLGLSGELLAHRKPHTVLPLSGVTHMTPQEVVAENLMLLTVDFFTEHMQ